MLAAIKNQKATHKNSTSMSSDFYLVLKEHCARTPSWLEKWESQDDELRKSFKVPIDCDLSSVWIVDAGCPREPLGRGVARITFEQRLATSMSAAPWAVFPRLLPQLLLHREAQRGRKWTPRLLHQRLWLLARLR